MQQELPQQFNIIDFPIWYKIILWIFYPVRIVIQTLVIICLISPTNYGMIKSGLSMIKDYQTFRGPIVLFLNIVFIIILFKTNIIHLSEYFKIVTTVLSIAVNFIILRLLSDGDLLFMKNQR